ncbi:ABC transporter permease [Acaryochloris sp. IP29b_bin.148]|uniref:ABC transporter permease n=1 Tax=Acaryochloris sp. IP29b_bin.148 TaxID=2969218 RepID=UPI00260C5BBD|nr:ABC transporter permease [Acaryochloris sp. IP29b_bin.148]
MTSTKVWPRFLPFPRRINLSLGLMLTGILITIVFIVIALLAPTLEQWHWIQDPNFFIGNSKHSPPSAKYWFGTDQLGHDVFARTLYGARAALQVVVAATIFSVIFGVILGLLSGYLGGWVDRTLLFLMDSIYAIPGLLIAVTLSFSIGEAARGVPSAAAALGVAYVPKYYRVVRNHTVSIKTELFVEAARALGASPWRIISRYLFGNVIQSVPVLFSLNAADSVLTLGALGFLGLGLPADIPEWGYDLKIALEDFTGDIWWTTLFPGLAMALLSIGLSLASEGLSEYFNPLQQRDTVNDTN